MYRYLFFLVFLNVSCDDSSTEAITKENPNILFIITDDQRWDMMGNMNSDLHTPEMDKLSREGVRFENAFVTTSICAASRASMLTGLVERTHKFTFVTPPLARNFTDQSYPQLLRQGGYRTGHIGKFGMKVEEGATDSMFDVFEVINRTPYFKEQEDGSLRHVTDLIGDRSIEFLRSNTNQQPFALTVSFNAPHAEDNDERQYIWPEEQNHLYQDLEIATPALSDSEFFSSQEEFMQDPKTSMNRYRWLWRFDNPTKSAEMTKGYYRMISGVDTVIGRLRQELEVLGLSENTVIVMIGDNGYFLGERGFAGKWLPYDRSLRVPLLYMDPRRDDLAGKRPEEIVLNIDVMPTILELAGVEVPKEVQGKGLVPLEKKREEFFVEHLMEHEQIVKHEGVRDNRYRYSRYFEQEPIYEELFDLETDPLETNNLATRAEYNDLLREMSARTDSLMDLYGGRYIPHSKGSAE